MGTSAPANWLGGAETWQNAHVVLSLWVPKDPGTPAGNAVFNITGEDVFLGVNDPSQSSLTLAAPGARGVNNKTITGFSRMITTRGGAYVFLPSITGLRYLAALPAA